MGVYLHIGEGVFLINSLSTLTRDIPLSYICFTTPPPHILGENGLHISELDSPVSIITFWSYRRYVYLYRKPFLIVESGLSYFISNFELHTYLKNYENVEEKFYLIPILTFSNFSLFLPNPPKIHFKIVETVPACLRHLCQFVREEGWLNRAKTSSKAETPWNQNNGLYCL